MKKVLYEIGPERITVGVAGEFIRGEAKELPDDVADMLLKKTIFKEVKERPKKKED